MNNISFLGCKPEYIYNGYRIIPISKDPTKREIIQAEDVTEDFSKCIGNGQSGTAFYMGEDLIVKKYDYYAHPAREIKTLNSMYDNSILSKGLQAGVFAFKTPRGTWYLVSKKIQGESIRNVNLNPDNLSCLLDVFLEFDKPKPNKRGEYGMYINRDIHEENILATDNSAGLIDYEYVDFVTLEKSKEAYNERMFPLRTSDIPGCVSNLRTFEITILFKCLNSDFMSEYKKEKLFYNYLLLKSNYHRKMSEHLEHEYEKSYDEYIKTLAIKHKAHADVLKNPDEDVLKAEYLKIKTGAILSTAVAVPRVYARQTYDFVLQNYLGAKNDRQQIYWKDCVDIIKKACEIADEGGFSGVYPDEINHYKNDNKELEENYATFNSGDKDKIIKDLTTKII